MWHAPMTSHLAELALVGVWILHQTQHPVLAGTRVVLLWLGAEVRNQVVSTLV
jgi:hypothetical protein